MNFVDSHAHLFAQEFDEDREEMMQRCFNAGVCRIFLPNIDVGTIDAMMQLTTAYPKNCFPMMGLHPCSVTTDYKQDLEQIEAHLKKGGFYAVGEIGIDLHWDKTTLPLQQEAFRIQVQWAKQLSLPIVIHVRESFDEVFEIIDALNDDRLTGIFHCFTGTEDQAKKIIGYGGFKMGLGGVLTFKNSGVAESIQNIDLKHFVLETDSPYLAPTPFRGKRNESAYIVQVAEKLAEVKGMDIQEVAEITTQNTKEVFGV